MALVLSKSVLEQTEPTRTVAMEAKEPVDHDKIVVHKFDIEIEIIPAEDYRKMTERWAELKTKHDLMKKDPDSPMSPEELRELQEPAYKFAGPYIKNIGPLQDESGNSVEFDSVKEALISQPWMQDPIRDAFFAVQNGITVAEHRRRVAKNS